MKQAFLRSPLGIVWTAYRRRQFLAAYEARREHYARALRGRVHDRDATIAELRERLRARGWTVAPRATGTVRVFAFFPLVGWHSDLLAELRRLGDVTHFDYIGRGFPLRHVFDFGARGRETRERMNAALFETLRAAHAQQPFDFAYFYASGAELLPSTLRRIREELGVPTAGMCLDDKNSWSGPHLGTHRAGQIDLAQELDLAWTSSRLACDWYLVEGGRAVYLPEGFNPAVYRREDVAQDLPVSFVGGAYGFRLAVIAWLRRRGVDVATFGADWKSSEPLDAIAPVFRRSKINLGMGGVGYTETITNVKGRDFEVPATGGGMYLTSYNSDLAQHFDVGREIVCYASRDEMLELIRYYLAHDDERAAIAQRGYERAWREHSWLQRFETICAVLGILPS